MSKKSRSSILQKLWFALMAVAGVMGFMAVLLGPLMLIADQGWFNDDPGLGIFLDMCWMVFLISMLVQFLEEA